MQWCFHIIYVNLHHSCMPMCREIRLRITATRAPANCVQLAGLSLMRSASDADSLQPRAASSPAPPARSEAAPGLELNASVADPVSSQQPSITRQVEQATPTSSVQQVVGAPAIHSDQDDVQQAAAELARLQTAAPEAVAPSQPSEQGPAAQQLAGRKLVPGQHRPEGSGQQPAHEAHKAEQSRPEQLAAEVARLFAVYRDQGLAPNDAAAKAITDAQALTR